MSSCIWQNIYPYFWSVKSKLWLFPIVPICSVRLVLKKAVRAQGSACNELESSRGRRALQLCSSERYRLWQHCARHMRPCVHQSFHALCLEVLRCHTFMVNLDPYSGTWTRTWWPGLDFLKMWIFKYLDFYCGLDVEGWKSIHGWVHVLVLEAGTGEGQYICGCQ